MTIVLIIGASVLVLWLTGKAIYKQGWVDGRKDILGYCMDESKKHHEYCVEIPVGKYSHLVEYPRIPKSGELTEVTFGYGDKK